MFRWIKALFQGPSDEDRGEYTAVRVKLTGPIPPATPDVILTQREWIEALKKEEQTGVALRG